MPRLRGRPITILGEMTLFGLKLCRVELPVENEFFKSDVHFDPVPTGDGIGFLERILTGKDVHFSFFFPIVAHLTFDDDVTIPKKSPFPPGSANSPLYRVKRQSIPKDKSHNYFFVEIFVRIYWSHKTLH